MVWGLVARAGVTLLKLSRPARFFKAAKVANSTRSIKPIAVVLAKFKATDIAVGASLSVLAVKFVDSKLRSWDMPDSDEASTAISDALDKGRAGKINSKEELAQVTFDAIRGTGPAGVILGGATTIKVLKKQKVPKWVIIATEVAQSII